MSRPLAPPASNSEADSSAATAVECSSRILHAASYDLVPLLEPIGQVWDLLGVSPHGLVLVTVVRGDWPEMLGLQRLGAPPRWPVQTTRVIHRYLEGQVLPEVRVLS
jgi:hypothetical protein